MVDVSRLSAWCRHLASRAFTGRQRCDIMAEGYFRPEKVRQIVISIVDSTQFRPPPCEQGLPVPLGRTSIAEFSLVF